MGLIRDLFEVAKEVDKSQTPTTDKREINSITIGPSEESLTVGGFIIAKSQNYVKFEDVHLGEDDVINFHMGDGSNTDQDVYLGVEKPYYDQDDLFILFDDEFRITSVEKVKNLNID